VTVSHATPPLVADSLPAAVAALRSKGLRLSAARRLVLEALFAAGGPVTAEAIAGGLDGRVPQSDLASVYRNLDLLEQVGLVRHFHAGHGPGRYTLAATREDPVVVTCERCGAFETVDSTRLDEVRELIDRELGYAVGFTHFPIVGVCPGCRAHS
jgi:Fur family ferric uptake transcriptional regulator